MLCSTLCSLGYSLWKQTGVKVMLWMFIVGKWMREKSFHIPVINIATMNCLCKHFLCWCTDVSVGSDVGFRVSVCLTVDVGLAIHFVGCISEWLQGALCRSDAWAQIDCNKEPLWISCADWSCETRAAVGPKCKVGNAFKNRFVQEYPVFSTLPGLIMSKMGRCGYITEWVAQFIFMLTPQKWFGINTFVG